MIKIKTNLMCGIGCCLSLLLWSCENQRNTGNNKEIAVEDTTGNDAIVVNKTGKTAEDRLAELRSWMSEKTSSGDTTGKDSSTVRREFKQRTAQLDARFDSLSEKSKEEYRQLKGRYNTWETRQQRRQQTPLQAAKVDQWQDQLLREYKALNNITPQNVREAYLTFMGVVRAKRQNWTQNDWDYVDHVYSRLNQRKREIDGQMSTSDKLKVKALQTEYLTLEGVADTQSMMGTIRD